MAVTLPLLVGTDGTLKMSKSYGNHIGISEDPAAMYGKAMSIPDALLRDYFDLATDVPQQEVAKLLSGDPMQAKMALSFAIVRRYRGEQAARHAAERFDREVRRKEMPSEMPEVKLSPDLLKDGVIWIARLIVQCGLAASTSNAKRLVQQGAVWLDGTHVTGPDEDVRPSSGSVLKVGKRGFARILL